MTELSDSHFQTLLDAIEHGDAIPSNIPAADAADLALAGKLLHLKVEPSQRLVAAVSNISRQPVRPIVSKRGFIVPKPMQRIALGAAFACALLLCAALIYPPTRQAMAQAIERITFGMITVVIIDEKSPTEIADPDKLYESYGSLWVPGVLEEIQVQYPKLATLPTSIPSGYVLQEMIGFFIHGTYSEEPSTIIYQWKNERNEWIQLEVHDSSCPEGYSFVGKDTCGHLYIGSEEPIFTTINGQKGVIRPGMLLDDFSGEIHKWNARHYRARETGQSLYWENNKILYILRTTSSEISQDEIVQIAESIP